MQVYRGHGDRAPHILDLSIRWRCDEVLAPFTLLLIPKDRRPGGPALLSGIEPQPSSPWPETEIVK